jgi:hypothetical protein
MNPDVYSAIVLSFLTKKFVFSLEPFAVNGVSRHSSGASSFFGSTSPGNVKSPADIFLSENNIPFHESLPLLKNRSPVRSRSVLVYESFLQASPFHHLKEISTTNKQQLEVALATSGNHHDEVLEWAQSFRRLYCISPSMITVVLLRVRNFIANLFNRLYSVFSAHRIYGSVRNPLSNVYDASVYAGILIKGRPSLVFMLASCIRIKLIERM